MFNHIHQYLIIYKNNRDFGWIKMIMKKKKILRLNNKINDFTNKIEKQY